MQEAACHHEAAIGSQHELFVGIERDANDAFRKQVADDTEGRHAFLRAMLTGPLDQMPSQTTSRYTCSASWPIGAWC
jgi:hypothetical protein